MGSIYPLTTYERGMYIEQKLNEKSTTYNLNFLLSIKGCEASGVKDALNAVFAANEAFHSYYGEENGIPVRILTDSLPAIEEKKASSFEEVKAIADDQAVPFDLQKEIPVRPTLYALTDGSFVLHFEIHHIAIDGGSLQTFVNELGDAISGKMPQADSVDMSDLYDQKIDKESGLTFYKDLFKDGIPVSELPLKGKRPKVHPASDKLIEFVIGADDLGIIGKTAQKYDATKFELLFSAVAMTLGKYTVSEDVVLGIPTNMRPEGADNVIGMFVNIAPVRIRVPRNEKIETYIGSVSKAVRNATHGSSLSFEDVVSEFVRQRDESRNPVFDVSVNYLWKPIPYYKDGLSIELFLPLQKMSRDIGITMQREGESLRVLVQYSSKLFEDEVVNNFVSQLQNTIKLITEGAAAVREAMSLPEEQLEKLERFSVEGTGEIPVRLLHKLFEKRVDENPEQIALIAVDGTFTYRELNNKANIVANKLIEKGIKTGDSVVLLLPRTSAFFACMFGVNKAGAAFIPCDPQYPADRIDHIITDSGASFIITTKDKCNEHDSDKVIEVEGLQKGGNIENPDLSIEPSALSYMIYTSGSTGKPKGVMLTHEGITNYLYPSPVNRHIYAVKNEANVYLSVTTVSFDMSFKEHAVTLCNGKTLVFAGDDEMNDPRALARLMEDNKVDCVNATPSRLMQYMNYAPFAKAIGNCRVIMSGGENYPLSLRDSLKAAAPNAKVINTYGPTEITVSCNAAVLNEAEYISGGRPLLNYKEYIVDRFGDLAPYGVIGELYIGGVGVAKGYRNLPEKTAEAFIEYCGERIYRSGDYAKWDKNGNVIILGRLDNQVKLRGLRIELGEIESVIESYDGIKEVAVVVRTIAGVEHIAAYYTSDDKIDAAALKEYAGSFLTHYMVPTAYMQLEEMPYTLNGKKDLKSLPDPVLLNETSAEETQRKLTKLEQELCDLAGRAIGMPVKNVDMSLLNLGLTSLTAISFTTYVEERFGCEIPVGKVMKGMNILEAEDFIIECLLKGNAGKEKPALTEELRDYYPLSANQLGVYYEVMKKPEELLYNMPLCYCFDSIDAKRLQKAISTAIRCHSYMNTHIEIKNGNLVQVRNDNASVDIPVIEMSAEEFEDHKNKFVRPFNLHSDILYRFEIILSNGKTYLLSDIHHIIFDGLSRTVFMDTVSKAYLGGQPGTEEFTYFEYALNEENNKESDHYLESEKYFSKLLSNFETVSEIPPDKKGRPEEGGIGAAEAVMGREAVDGFCRENAVTPSSLFLAATFYVVSRFTNSRNVYISTISGGRNNNRIRKTIGMFVHTLPLYMNFEQELSAAELIGISNESMLSSIEHEDYPFMQIADKFGYSTGIMYECQLGVGGKDLTLGDAKYTAQFLKLETPKFKVTVAIEDRDDGIAVSLRYNDAIYTHDYMMTLASSIITVAQRMIDDKGQNVKTISLLNDSEQREIEAFGRTAGSEPEAELLHRMFEKSALKNPTRTALIAVDQSLTYEELDQSANCIANNLISVGVKERDSIVLLLPRRSYYFSALFGVLKTGAAFIPCDPEYPADRIRHIISDSDAAFIITTDEHIGDYPKEKALLIDSLLDGNKKDSPMTKIDGSDLAYMIYTSGSTGKPKGVMLTHKGICSFCTAHPANILYQLAEDEIETMLAVTTVSFDLSLKDTVGMLCNGKTVIFASETEMNDPRALTALIEKNNADAMNATPSRYMQYMEYAPFKEALKRCKLVMAGGEAFSDALLDRLKELKIPHIINTYGPTETTISSNMAFLQNEDHVSVGRPLLNYSEHIVDLDLNPLPKGVHGELLIGGLGVARGYKNLDEQTASRFIEYRGERVYRSGDFAKWDNDGNVVILGRMDNQVKLRGLRIELGEIEGLIDKQPHIKKAVVVIKKIAGVENLCAYYTADCEISPEELREELKKSLTHYMVPSAYLQLDMLPVTPNGKIDLKALPNPVPVSAGEYSAPRNETEEYFCGLFQKVLGLEKVGANDSFFEIGGTSLLVTSVVIEAAERGYEITYGDIFRKTTPRALAEMFTSDEVDQSVSIVDFDDYDYSKIKEMLSRNNMQSLCGGEIRPVGNIMLTGATGFMGAHVLAQYLREESGNAYCLVRKGRFSSAKERLMNIFFYYFDSELEDEFDRRVTVFDGDVTDPEAFVPMEELPVDTVFNCAANVKHFSNGTDIEDVNVGGAKNCVRFCERTGARLIHFSTTSVCGASVDDHPPAGSVLDEQTLYIGQRLDTKYTNSKLLSERVVLEAAAERDLDAKVIRVGTLSAREIDGEFQINFLTNNFMGRLRSFEILGCFPYSMMNSPVCLSPIDESAKAFFALAKTPKECCLFNCTNNHSMPLSDIIIQMQRSGMNVKITSDDVFAAALSEAEKDPKKAAILSSMLAYKNMAHGKRLVSISPVNNYTTQVLAKMGFFWKPSSVRYILDFISALSSLNFFDSTNLNR